MSWTPEARDRAITALGLVLLAGYVAQALAGLDVTWLRARQADDAYKIGSGLVVGGYLYAQWRVGARRLVDPKRAVWRHKLLGAFAPLVLYAHATRLAYGYLLLLALVYLGVVLVGFANAPILRHRARRLFTAWFVVHVASAVALAVLATYHVVIALAYE